MKRRKYKRYLIQSLSVLCISLVCLITYLVVDFMSEDYSLDDNQTIYVSYEILTDNVVPVISEKDNSMIRPYSGENVKIGKSFYDYKSEESQQENSIVYYEGTYIQNMGVDYTAPEKFTVNAVLDGKIISITNDEIVGNTIKIQHNNGTITTYQSLSEVLVKQDETVKKGDAIGTSGSNAYGKDLGNHLHFELYYKNKLVNPEEYYNKTLED